MTQMVEKAITGILRKVKDPELNINLVDGKLISKIMVKEDDKSVEIRWIPTTPFCPLVLVISAAMILAIRKNLEMGEWKVKVLLDDSVSTAQYWNKQLDNDEIINKIIDNLESSGQIKYFITE